MPRGIRSALGTSHADTIVGTAGRDSLDGHGGHDGIAGLGGGDRIALDAGEPAVRTCGGHDPLRERTSFRLDVDRLRTVLTRPRP